MILFWRIRYLDQQDRMFKDRDLYLDTSTLDGKTRAAVELCCELSESGTSRQILKYRGLFLEDNFSVAENVAILGDTSFKTVFFVKDYFEDGCGNELSAHEVGRILTGSPTAVAIPPGARQHDIDYMLAPPAPIKIDELHLSDNDLEVFSYFVRDLRELEGAAFNNDGPGRLSWSKEVEPMLQTAVSDEEIRSFLTIFRRLYMSREPASFLCVVEKFSAVVGDFPLVRWVQGVARQYEAELGEKPHFFPFDGAENITFSRKRLIDVFLYTRYAHQPDTRRSQQFQECLKSVGNRSQLLTYLFLTELWLASVHILNAGRVIARVYDAYCKTRGYAPILVDSIHRETPGIGQLEKKKRRRKRILAEKAKQLAESMWEDCGKPEGGPALFLLQAREQLNVIE